MIDREPTVEEMLEQWEMIKASSAPQYSELCEAIENEFAKFEVDKIASHLRVSRMMHECDEDECAREFARIFNEFSQNVIYRILKDNKNGN